MKVVIGKYPKNPDTPRKVKIQIDPWDTWSMDDTLALIITPMLKQLRDTKHGAPVVHDDDVPEHLRRSAASPTENEWDADDNFFPRWDHVLDEMIFAFESKHTNWEDKYFTPEMKSMLSLAVNEVELYQMEQERIANGFRLFGKYYQGLWD